MKNRGKRFPAVFLLACYLLAGSSCTKEQLPPESISGHPAAGDSVVVRLSLQIAPVTETKGTVRPARQGSEAQKSGFYYEFVRDSVPDVQTKAATSLKSIYAFLFDGTSGAYVGQSSVSEALAQTGIEFTFAGNPTQSDCRLIVVALDASASVTLPAALTGFTGNYDTFKALTFSETVKLDTDIPYVGERTGVSLVAGGLGNEYSLPIYRMMAKVTFNLTNSVPDLSLTDISLKKVPENPFFGTSNSYDGSGILATTGSLVDKGISMGSGTSQTFTWYVGENIQGAVNNSCGSMADRNSKNAGANAAYIRVTTSHEQVIYNKPAIGEEYKKSTGYSYDIYLGTGVSSGSYGDFNLRRNNNYIITSEISGTIALQLELSEVDKRVTTFFQDSEALNIGMFGGWTPGGSYGKNDIMSSISGGYTKSLLLSKTEFASKNLSYTSIYESSVGANMWDHAANWQAILTGGGTADGNKICETLGEGWYLPSLAQVMAMTFILQNGNLNTSYVFNGELYGSSTSTSQAGSYAIDYQNWHVIPLSGNSCNIRCVRDL